MKPNDSSFSIDDHIATHLIGIVVRIELPGQCFPVELLFDIVLQRVGIPNSCERFAGEAQVPVESTIAIAVHVEACAHGVLPQPRAVDRRGETDDDDVTLMKIVQRLDVFSSRQSRQVSKEHEQIPAVITAELLHTDDFVMVDIEQFNIHRYRRWRRCRDRRSIVQLSEQGIPSYSKIHESGVIEVLLQFFVRRQVKFSAQSTNDGNVFAQWSHGVFCAKTSHGGEYSVELRDGLVHRHGLVHHLQNPLAARRSKSKAISPIDVI